jgi:hypothetical protein
MWRRAVATRPVRDAWAAHVSKLASQGRELRRSADLVERSKRGQETRQGKATLAQAAR